MFTLFDAFCRFTLVPLLLRAGLAAIFIYHGLDMVQKDGGAGWNPSLSRPEQLAVAWGELLGGIALALGMEPVDAPRSDPAASTTSRTARSTSEARTASASRSSPSRRR